MEDMSMRAGIEEEEDIVLPEDVSILLKQEEFECLL